MLGAALAALGLAALTYGLIETENVPLILGVVILAGFVIVEHRRGAQALVPVTIFTNRTFTAVNVVTLFMYAAMGVVFFLLVLQLRTVSGFSPFAAGSALVPVTLLMLVISPYAGELARRIGPRWPMTIGILLAGTAFMWMSRIGAGAHYLTEVLPPVTLFGLGLSATVAPLTATVLASASQRHAGIASGVNNAVARTGSLLSVAAVPPLVGLTGEAYRNPALFDTGFQLSMYACAGMMAISALISLVGIKNPFLAEAEPEQAVAFGQLRAPLPRHRDTSPFLRCPDRRRPRPRVGAPTTRSPPITVTAAPNSAPFGPGMSRLWFLVRPPVLVPGSTWTAFSPGTPTTSSSSPSPLRSPVAREVPKRSYMTASPARAFWVQASVVRGRRPLGDP